MEKWIWSGISGLLMTVCISVYSEQLPTFVEFSEKKINRKLATQFPMSKSYDNVHVTFSQPTVDIDVLEKTLEITVQLDLVYQQHSMMAKGVFEGNVEYQVVDDTIVFDRPQLTHFYVKQDNMPDSTHAQKVVKQSMQRGYPDFVLIDLAEHSLRSGAEGPSEIEISIDKLIVHWNSTILD